MTKVEGYRITAVCFTNEALCVCMLLSYRTAGQASPVQEGLEYGKIFTQRKRNILQSADPLSLVENV